MLRQQDGQSRDGSFVSESGSNEKRLQIQNTRTNEIIEVTATREPNGHVVMHNLPDELEVNIYHYTHEERWSNFHDVVVCLMSLHATLNGFQLAENNQELQT